MRRPAAQMRLDMFAIWQAGLAAVESSRLVRENLRVEDGWLVFGTDFASQGEALEPLRLDQIERIVVVGAGKAGAGMAAGVEAALGETIARSKRLSGLVNVPADCLCLLKHIELVAARPAGRNEPTVAGQKGAEAMLQIVDKMGPRDLCIALISGGGSALLPAPLEGVSLAEKQSVTRFLSDAGANIQQLNTVRKQLSRIKGGGLARACRTGRMQALVISDVPGDALDIIASGPTVPDRSTPSEAIHILDQFGAIAKGVSPDAIAMLRRKIAAGPALPFKVQCDSGELATLVIGNNATAVDAAGIEAERRGYSHAMCAATQLEPAAEEVGIHLANLAYRMQREAGPDCLISGGEPVVRLVDASRRGLGGRNQQLALAAAMRIDELRDTSDYTHSPLEIAFLSGGTDGEDGPTDAAGAFFDRSILLEAREKKMSPADFLERNDAYHFFDPLRALLRTGPTQTNVGDLRVIVVDRIETERTPPSAHDR